MRGEKIKEALDRYYPHLTDDEQYGLLFNSTAFPAGDDEYLVNQIKELSEKTDGTLEGAMQYAVDEMDRVVETLRKEGKWPT